MLQMFDNGEIWTVCLLNEAANVCNVNLTKIYILYTIIITIFLNLNRIVFSRVSLDFYIHVYIVTDTFVLHSHPLS